jgi:hypothetical protein
MSAEQKQRRKIRVEERSKRLLELKYEGYKIAHVYNDTYLVNGLVYVSLTHNIYRNKKTNESGTYWDVKRFIRQYIDRFKNIEYIVDWIEPPRTPKFKFLRFRPKLRKFLKEYISYKCQAVKYHQKFYSTKYNDQTYDK